MAAPVLTPVEQKKALSGRNKKKRAVKNVLGLPSNLQIESHVIRENEAEPIRKLLESLLPSARIPFKHVPRFQNNEEVNIVPEESAAKENAKVKRKQLSLGVNETSNSLKKDLLEAVLLASDIQPKFFFHHLNLLCSHKKVPYLHFPGLRAVTKNSLGFPCIALGFKKNFNDFLQAVEKIKSISDAYNFSSNKVCEEIKEETIESGEDSNECSVKSETNETPFTYLYRTSTKERVFIPEEHEKNYKESKTAEDDFLPLTNNNDDEEDVTKLQIKPLGISQNLIKKKKGKMLTVEDINVSEIYDEDNLEVPKKKPKKDWIIDTVGDKSKFRYSSPNLVRFHSNPNRIKKRNK